MASDGHPGIVIGAMEPSGQRGFVIFLGIDPDLYTPGATLPIDNTHVSGGFLELDGNGQMSKMSGMLRGSLQLHAAGHEPHSPVEGELSVDVFSKFPAP